MSHNLQGPHFDLPMPPAAAETLSRMQTEQELNFRELADTARQVPALQALVLRAANAASNGLLHPISKPEHAIAMLGNARLKTLVDELCQQNEALRSTTIRARRRRRKPDEAE